MLSSRLPIASAPVSCSSSSSSSTVSALPPSSTAAVSALNHSSNKDELIAHDCPSDFLQSSGLLLSNGTGIKTMNLCVPEWDATGREMDMIWDPTELCSPSKGKCDSGQTRRPDLGFVPEHDFEELCWEDGQLIVMQGLSSKGNFKNRSYWQVSASETAPLLLGRPASGMDSTFDRMGMGTGELMDSSTVNMHAQDDELLSWLQHPCDELVDKLEIPSDALPTSTAPSMGSERLCPGDFIHHGIRQNTMNAGETSSGPPALKSLRYDTFLSSQTTMLHKPGHEHGDVPQHIHMNALPGSSITPTIITSSKEQFEHGSMMVRLEMPPPQMHPAMAVVNCGHSVSSGSMSSMNFSNFSRPAGAFKANFHSVGMASGPSGAECLKQLDRVAVDALKAESIDSTTKHLRLIAPKRGGVAPIAPNVSRSVGASVVHNRPQSFSLRREAEQGGSANGAVNGSSGMVDKSGDLNLSITSSAALGTEGSTEVLEVAEPSYTSSSGGSEESDGVDVKQATGVCKRKVNDEDSEIQSKSESTGTKKHATGGGKSMKGSRASKNHNQSERRRRDRISEKMKALQALVPNSYKTDKASMLEEAIAYVKALKAQIQMMSYRSGMYFSPMLIPQGMQHVQMAAWPHMGMGMGMGMGRGMGVGMGMHDMNMTSSQFSPLVSIPGAVMPAAHAAPSAALDSAWSMHVVPPPAHQIMVPIRPGNLSAGTCDSSPTPNVASHMLFPASQQQQPVQCTSPQIVVTGGHGNCMPYIH